MSQESKQQKLAKFLDSSYDLIIGGKIPGTSTAIELAESYMKNEPDKIVAAKKLIRWQNAKAAADGFFTGLGGLVTLPVAIPTNMASVMFFQIRMIAAIAHMGGYDLKDDRVRTLVYMCLAGNGISDLVKPVGIEVAKLAGNALIRQIPRHVISQINRAVGAKLLTKFGTKGIINLGKAVPLLGGVVGATFDGVTTNVIGNVAVKTFLEGNDALQSSEEPSLDEKVRNADAVEADIISENPTEV